MLQKIAFRILSEGSPRRKEYNVAADFLDLSKQTLDVGCGTGTFLELSPENIVGLDINPENIEFCKSKGLNAFEGSALKLPFEDRSFSGVHCSHLLQILTPAEVVVLMKELSRVLKRDGILVISTLNSFRNFYRHPENIRPYPPDSIRRLFQKQKGAQSPMFPQMPEMIEEDIWFRHPSLIEFKCEKTKSLSNIVSVLNAIQRILMIKKFWTFDSYIIKLRKV
jgi:ubiquinone/menaquinone biosynthesis C-methylase UbiE